jgi:hypothetical protein
VSSNRTASTQTGVGNDTRFLCHPKLHQNSAREEGYINNSDIREYAMPVANTVRYTQLAASRLAAVRVR